MALIFGSNGHDSLLKSLHGTSKADVIIGFDGDDWVFAGAGNDTVALGQGRSIVDLGTGDDRLVIHGTAGNSFQGGDGQDTLEFTTAQPVTLYLGQQDGFARVAMGPEIAVRGFENATTGGGNDRISGSGESNVISSGGGHDTVWGNGGADRIDAGAGDDVVHGGTGDDWITAGTGADKFYGDEGWDTLNYATSATAIEVDVLAGTVQAGGQTDTVWGIDRFMGSDKGDTFKASLILDADFMGLGGDDRFTAGGGKDGFYGGEGRDSVSYETATSGVTVALGEAGPGTTAGGAAGDVLTSIESLYGSRHADTLTGSSADNNLYGGEGHDRISGGGGKDFILGGAGSDTMTGGAGADTFLFYDVDRGAADRITDFQLGSDKIALAMTGNDQAATLTEFTRLTHLDAPGASDQFTAGTINVRYANGSTYVDLNTSDALVNGVDVAEYTIRLDGIHDLRMSDFAL